jgi:hypothetical protein
MKVSTDSCVARGCAHVRRADADPVPGESGLAVCPACRERTGADLADLPRLYDECESLLIAAPRALAEKVSGRVATDVHLNESAVAVRSDIVAILASWAGLIVAERAVAKPVRRDVAMLAGFVARHLDWLFAHPAAADFADEVTALAKLARRTAQPGAQIHLELGKCVRPGCESTLFATTHGDGGVALTGHVRCDSGHVWEAHQWLPLAHRLKQAKWGKNGS